METENKSLLEKPACLASQAQCGKCHVNMMPMILFCEKDQQLGSHQW